MQREDPFAALILAFPVAEEEMVIQRQIVEFCRRLDNQKHTTSYEVRMGCGNIYDRLKDIRYSWLEAQKKLNHIRFYGVDEPESGTSLLPYQNHYFEQARQIIRAARDQRLEEARQQLDDITSVMAKQTISGENPGKNCREFLDALLELTEALHVVNVDELLRRQKEQLFIHFDTGEDQAEMIDQVKEFCVQLLELVARRNKTKSSQHVERIREYIHTNYSDSSLSLYMAAEQVGLSPSYLSRLFKQEMGASFVDYISSVRVEKAKELLESSDLMVKDIAYQTGFNSMPNFFAAMVLMYFLSIRLGVLPVVTNTDLGQSIILPTLTLAISMAAKYTRQVRATVLEELNKDYVTGARARGIRSRVIIWKSVMKASMLTIITLLALSIGNLLGGTAIVENIFMWDGVGKLAVDAITMRDYPIIQAYVAWMAVIYVLVNLVTDIIYHYLDPRVRLGGDRA